MIRALPRLLLRHALALMDHPVGIAIAALFFIWLSLLVSR